MRIQQISAITLAVTNMDETITFYKKLGLEISYREEDSGFTTFRVGNDALNLVLVPSKVEGWWGRVIIRVNSVDSIYEHIKVSGLTPEKPKDAPWGERFFHIWDPDGHEISFAESLPENQDLDKDF